MAKETHAADDRISQLKLEGQKLRQKPINPLIQDDHCDTLCYSAHCIQMVKDMILDPGYEVDKDGIQMTLQGAIDAINYVCFNISDGSLPTDTVLASQEDGS